MQRFVWINDDPPGSAPAWLRGMTSVSTVLMADEPDSDGYINEVIKYIPFRPGSFLMALKSRIAPDGGEAVLRYKPGYKSQAWRELAVWAEKQLSPEVAEVAIAEMLRRAELEQ